MVRNFYLPDPGPDWTKALGEDYARQDRQRREDLANKLNNSAQLEQADSGVRNLAMFKQILATTKTGIDVYNAFANESAEAKDKKFKQQKKKYLDKSRDEQIALSLKLNDNFKDIQRNDEEGAKILSDHLDKKFDGKLTKEDKHNILEHFYSASGSEAVKFEQVIHSQFLRTLTREEFFKWSRNRNSTYGKGTAYDDIQSLSIESTQYKNYLNDFVNEKVEKELGGVSDELKSTSYHEVERLIHTKSSSKQNAKLVAFNKANTANKINYLSSFNTSATSEQKAGHLQAWITRSAKKYETVPGGPTAIQQAVEEIRPHLVKMGEDRELDAATWQDIREGIIKHPAGDNIIKAFDKEGFLNTAVEEGIQRGVDLDTAQQKVLATQQVQRGFLLAQQGQLNETQYNSLARVISTGVDFEKKDQLLEDLENAFHNNRGKDTTQETLAFYSPEITRGTLTQDHVDAVPNYNANKALQAKFDLQELAKTRGQVESKRNGLEGDVTSGKKGVLNLGKISTATNQVRDDILNFYNENFYAKVHAAGEGGDFQVLAAQALAETKTYMEVNGFGKKTGDVGAGKFSSDGWSGEYTLYSQSYSKTIISDDYLNANHKATPENQLIWDKNIAKTNGQPGYGTPTERFAQHDGLFSNGMLGHWAETGEISDQMLYIAKKNKLNISRALGYSINAKLNSNRNEDKAFVKNFNLNKIKTKDWPDQTILDKGYDRVTVLQSGGKNAKDPLQLLAQAKTQGFDSLSRNQLQRLFVHLEGEELTGVEAIKYKLRQSGKSHEEINQIFEDEIRKRKEQLIENTKYTKNYG
tara:strand:- start:312 stop:2744 length:2433 start_codon:yes stop_codon:yes gene_type:complete